MVILKDCGGNRPFKRVLVPVAGGRNAAFALEIAGILADDEEGEITAMTVTGHGGPFDLAAFVEENHPRMGIPRDRVRTRTVQGRHVDEAILAQADDYDLIVLGCTAQPLLSQFVHSSVPEAVAQACDKPVVMGKMGGGLRSWIKRWI